MPLPHRAPGRRSRAPAAAGPRRGPRRCRSVAGRLAGRPSRCARRRSRRPAARSWEPPRARRRSPRANRSPPPASRAHRRCTGGEGGVEDGEPEAAPAHAGTAARRRRSAPTASRHADGPAQSSRTTVGRRAGSARRRRVAAARWWWPGGRPRDPGVGRRRAAPRCRARTCRDGRRRRATRGGGAGRESAPRSRSVGAAPAGEPVERRVCGVHRRVDPGVHVVGAGAPERTPRGRSGPRRRRGSWPARAAGCRSAVAPERVVGRGALEQVGEADPAQVAAPERLRAQHRRPQRLAHVHAGDAHLAQARRCRAGRCPAVA